LWFLAEVAIAFGVLTSPVTEYGNVPVNFDPTLVVPPYPLGLGLSPFDFSRPSSCFFCIFFARVNFASAARIRLCFRFVPLAEQCKCFPRLSWRLSSFSFACQLLFFWRLRKPGLCLCKHFIFHQGCVFNYLSFLWLLSM